MTFATCQPKHWSVLFRGCCKMIVRAMSHEAIYRQPVPGNLQATGSRQFTGNQFQATGSRQPVPGNFQEERKAIHISLFTYFSCGWKDNVQKGLICYRSSFVSCTVVGCLQVACKKWPPLTRSVIVSFDPPNSGFGKTVFYLPFSFLIHLHVL